MAKAKRKTQSNNNKAAKQPQKRLRFEVSSANAVPIRSRLDRSQSVDVKSEEGKGIIADVPGASEDPDQNFLANHFKRAIEVSSTKDLLPPPPPLPFGLDQRQNFDHAAISGLEESILLDDDDRATVTNGPLSQPTTKEMNVNGSRPQHRHQQAASKDSRNHAIDASPVNTPAGGPLPSHIQVAKPFVFQQVIERCLSDLGVTQAREDNIRLAGVQWIDSTRKALKLPVRTFDTAVIYYHKFRLTHADNEYSFVDAAAASLFAACKIEDTLKKSRDILCAAHNTNIKSRADHLPSDDPLFENQSRTTIGLERLMLEASSFDFRNRHPQHLLMKLAKHYGYERHSAITKTAYQISLDLYKTFAPLKQSTPAMAFTCLELAGRLHGQEKEVVVDAREYKRWSIDRAMVMETLLDLLELYTHYRSHTTVGPLFPLDTFIEVRLPLNEELAAKNLPRYTEYSATKPKPNRNPSTNNTPHTGTTTTQNNNSTHTNTATNQTPNGNKPTTTTIKQSPASPATPSTPVLTSGAAAAAGIRQRAGERGKEGTVRFMINPEREREEKRIVKLYEPLLERMRL